MAANCRLLYARLVKGLRLSCWTPVPVQKGGVRDRLAVKPERIIFAYAILLCKVEGTVPSRSARLTKAQLTRLLVHKQQRQASECAGSYAAQGWMEIVVNIQ